MSTIKALLAKNSLNELNVLVEFNLENQPIKVTNDSGEIEYKVVGHVERHALITIQDPKNRDLFSIFYSHPR